MYDVKHWKWDGASTQTILYKTFMWFTCFGWRGLPSSVDRCGKVPMGPKMGTQVLAMFVVFWQRTANAADSKG